MTAQKHELVLWDFGDQRWSQHSETGAFELVAFGQLGVPAKAYAPRDIAALSGAHLVEGEGGAPPALYPSRFRFSPLTGKELPRPSQAAPDVWLPPCGGPIINKPNGLRLTAAPLSLRSSLTIESRPDVELPLPPPGDHRFLVGAFTTRAPRLLAVESSKGLLHCWLPASGSWEEVLPAGSDPLGECSLSDDAWAMAAPDLLKSTDVFLPTDQGPTLLSINLVELTYQARIVGTPCPGAPAWCPDRLYAPLQAADHRVGVQARDPRGPKTIDRFADAPVDADITEWTRPIVDARQVIWMSSAGQLVLKHRSAPALDVSFIPWGRGLTPRFEFGSAYAANDGQIWQQCFQEDASGGRRYVFVQLGRHAPTILPTSSPRLSTGVSSFKLETLLRGHPWTDPEVDMDAGADEVIIPLLESVSSRTILCARVPHTGAVDSVFASADPFRTTFQLHGEREVRFWVKLMSRPWLTRPFVFAGHLYLYHPELPSIPGWRTS